MPNNQKDKPMAEQQVADAAAASSAGIAGLTWVAPLNELLQLGATAVAIVAGVYAIIWHRTRIKHAESVFDAREDVKEKVEDEQGN